MSSGLFKAFAMSSAVAVCFWAGSQGAHGADAVMPATMPTSMPTSMPTTAPVAITWDQATKHVGETVIITGMVAGTHVPAGGETIVLNIGKDYPDKTRFSVMITGDTQGEEAYKGKTVSVTGKIEMYKSIPEIKAKPADVTIAK